MRSWPGLAVAALVCVAVLVGVSRCSTPDEDVARVMLVDLAGSGWVAEQLDGRPLLPDAPATLHFDARERISGSTGCNLFRGSVSSQGASVRFGPLATTRRGCAQALAEQEERYLTALGAARSLRKEGDRLLVIDGFGAQRIRFTPGRAGRNAGL